MAIAFDPPYDSPPRGRVVRLSIPAPIHRRLESLREVLERRFRIRLGEEELIAYLCEKALEKLEDWERRTRPS
jgi:hypothetical protein